MAILTVILALAASGHRAEAARPLFEIVPIPAEYQDAPPMPPPPAPRPMVPPPPPRPGTVLQPRNQGSWVTDDDYPPVAVRENMQGTVAFALSVEPDGRVSACRVERSSGWPVLDGTTCALMRRRAKFTPAADADGRPISATYFNRFRWGLPFESVSPMTSWARVTRFQLDANGVVVGCTTRRFRAPDYAEQDACAAADMSDGKLAETLGTATGPVTFDLVEMHAVGGSAMPRGFAMPEGTAVWEHGARLTIGYDGFVRGCSRSGSERPAFLLNYLNVCAPDWTYPVADDPSERQAVLRISLIRESK